jgi:hypothetical protein
VSDPSARRPGPRPGAGRPTPQGSTARADADRQRIVGIVIIAIAVLIGVLLVFRGLSDAPGELGGPSDAVATTTTVDRDAPPPTDPDQSITVVPAPADVIVIVANGSGVAGLAGQTSETLAGLGFQTLEPTNVDEGAINSSIYYVEGSEPAAVEVAAALGLPASSVAPLPTPAPVASIGDAVVLVVLGADFTSAAGE